MSAPVMITITLRGQAVAVTLADQARITDELDEDDRRVVEAMCLYALRIQRGELPGPYTEQDALEFAWTLLDEIEAGTDEPKRASWSHGVVEREEPHGGLGDAGCNKNVPIQPPQVSGFPGDLQEVGRSRRRLRGDRVADRGIGGGLEPTGCQLSWRSAVDARCSIFA
jgi:hypothetical protein